MTHSGSAALTMAVILRAADFSGYLDRITMRSGIWLGFHKGIDKNRGQFGRKRGRSCTLKHWVCQERIT